MVSTRVGIFYASRCWSIMKVDRCISGRSFAAALSVSQGVLSSRFLPFSGVCLGTAKGSGHKFRNSDTKVS